MGDASSAPSPPRILDLKDLWCVESEAKWRKFDPNIPEDGMVRFRDGMILEKDGQPKQKANYLREVKVKRREVSLQRSKDDGGPDTVLIHPDMEFNFSRNDVLNILPFLIRFILFCDQCHDFLESKERNNWAAESGEKKKQGPTQPGWSEPATNLDARLGRGPVKLLNDELLNPILKGAFSSFQKNMLSIKQQLFITLRDSYEEDRNWLFKEMSKKGVPDMDPTPEELSKRTRKDKPAANNVKQYILSRFQLHIYDMTSDPTDMMTELIDTINKELFRIEKHNETDISLGCSSSISRLMDGMFFSERSQYSSEERAAEKGMKILDPRNINNFKITVDADASKFDFAAFLLFLCDRVFTPGFTVGTETTPWTIEIYNTIATVFDSASGSGVIGYIGSLKDEQDRLPISKKTQNLKILNVPTVKPLGDEFTAPRSGNPEDDSGVLKDDDEKKLEADKEDSEAKRNREKQENDLAKDGVNTEIVLQYTPYGTGKNTKAIELLRFSYNYDIAISNTDIKKITPASKLSITQFFNKPRKVFETIEEEKLLKRNAIEDLKHKKAQEKYTQIIKGRTIKGVPRSNGSVDKITSKYKDITEIDNIKHVTCYKTLGDFGQILKFYDISRRNRFEGTSKKINNVSMDFFITFDKLCSRLSSLFLPYTMFENKNKKVILAPLTCFIKSRILKDDDYEQNWRRDFAEAKLKNVQDFIEKDMRERLVPPFLSRATTLAGSPKGSAAASSAAEAQPSRRAQPTKLQFTPAGEAQFAPDMNSAQAVIEAKAFMQQADVARAAAVMARERALLLYQMEQAKGKGDAIKAAEASVKDLPLSEAGKFYEAGKRAREAGAQYEAEALRAAKEMLTSMEEQPPPTDPMVEEGDTTMDPGAPPVEFGKAYNKLKNTSIEIIKNKLKSVGILITKVTNTGKRVPLTKKELERKAMVFTKLQMAAKSKGIRITYKARNGSKKHKSLKRLLSDIKKYKSNKMKPKMTTKTKMTMKMKTKVKMPRFGATRNKIRGFDLDGRPYDVPSKEMAESFYKTCREAPGADTSREQNYCKYEVYCNNIISPTNDPDWRGPGTVLNPVLGFKPKKTNSGGMFCAPVYRTPQQATSVAIRMGQMFGVDGQRRGFDAFPNWVKNTILNSMQFFAQRSAYERAGAIQRIQQARLNRERELARRAAAGEARRRRSITFGPTSVVTVDRPSNARPSSAPPTSIITGDRPSNMFQLLQRNQAGPQTFGKSGIGYDALQRPQRVLSKNEKIIENGRCINDPATLRSSRSREFCRNEMYCQNLKLSKDRGHIGYFYTDPRQDTGMIDYMSRLTPGCSSLYDTKENATRAFTRGRDSTTSKELYNTLLNSHEYFTNRTYDEKAALNHLKDLRRNRRDRLIPELVFGSKKNKTKAKTNKFG